LFSRFFKVFQVLRPEPEFPVKPIIALQKFWGTVEGILEQARKSMVFLLIKDFFRGCHENLKTSENTRFGILAPEM
jgi:hypothetical protein